MEPDADLLAQYARHGGTGPTHGGVKVCWGADEQAAVALAHGGGVRRGPT